MDGLYQIMYFTVIDIKNTLISPFFIAIFFIIFYQYYSLENTGHTQITKWYIPAIKAINSSLFGLMGGFLTTIAFIYLEVSVVPRDFIYIIFTSIILTLIDPRFMCIAYSGSIISILSILIHFPVRITEDIMLIVATLHIVESILIFINGYMGRSIAYFEKGNDIVGGFNINRFWPIPFVIFIGDGLIRPITLMSVLAYGDYTFSYPGRKTIITSLILLIYSTTLLMLIKLTNNPLIPPIFSLIGHELIVHINIFYEKNKSPIFTNVDRGLRVIEVSKKGIAKSLGISTGDIILSINDILINEYKDLLEIENFSNGYMRVNYFSKRKGLVTKTYNGHKKTLGVVSVPRAVYP